jgi:hypothetical protein
VDLSYNWHRNREEYVTFTLRDQLMNCVQRIDNTKIPNFLWYVSLSFPRSTLPKRLPHFFLWLRDRLKISKSRAWAAAYLTELLYEQSKHCLLFAFRFRVACYFHVVRERAMAALITWFAYGSRFQQQEYCCEGRVNFQRTIIVSQITTRTYVLNDNTDVNVTILYAFSVCNHRLN